MYKQAPRFLLGLSLGFLFLVGAGCHRDLNAAGLAATPDNSGPDPAAANMAPVNNNQPAAAPAPALRVRFSEFAPRPQHPRLRAYPPAIPSPASRSAATADQDQAYQDAQTAEQLDEEGQTPPSNTPTSRLRRCPSTSSPKPPRQTTSGPPATGIGVPPATTGSPAPGALRPTTVPSGPPAIGAGITTAGASTVDSGAFTSASTVASTTASATPASAITAATGTATTSTTTAPLTASAPTSPTSTTAQSSSTTTPASPTTAAEAGSPSDRSRPRSLPCAVQEFRPCRPRSRTSAKLRRTVNSSTT